MNFTAEQLRKTKVGQMPANQPLLEAHAKTRPLGGLLPTQPKQNAVPALEQKPRRTDPGKNRMVAVVTIIRCGMRYLDDDNCGSAYKGLRDSICTSIGVDDGDKGKIRFQYSSIASQGAKGTLVMIELKKR